MKRSNARADDVGLGSGRDGELKIERDGGAIVQALEGLAGQEMQAGRDGMQLIHRLPDEQILAGHTQSGDFRTNQRSQNPLRRP